MSGNLRPSSSLPQNNHHACTRESSTPSSRRSSMDICSTKASSKHASTEKPRTARHSMPALPPNTSTSRLTDSEASLDQSAQRSSDPLTTGTNRSTNFGSVSLDPPITRAVLRELDIPRLENDLGLRHYLNFDPEIEFRVDTQGPQAEERQQQARQYWQALAVEIALWLGHFQRITGRHSSQPTYISLPEQRTRSFPQSAALRLPRLLEAVQDIMKHLLPSEEWPIIEAALDVRLLIQQLEHGVCDFMVLSDWLVNYLKRFCSPSQGCLLHTMTSAIRLGIGNAETDRIVDGLIIIFEILEGMGLETTNRSIMDLRLAWVEDTIAFEQTVFRRWMENGWDVMGARLWFDGLQEAAGETQSGLWTLVKALTDAVVTNHRNLPPTLILDYNRLRKLQVDFQVLVYQAACRRTLTQTLRNLGWMGKLSPESCADLSFRVAAVISDPGLEYDYWQRRDSVALEIVRAAYAVCSNSKVPSVEDVDFAENHLRLCCDPRGSIFEMLRRPLVTELADRIDDEVCAIGGFSPEQLMRRLVPQQPRLPIQSEVEALVHVAKRIAHIAELHWRVWGPILYQRPMHSREVSLSSPFDEGVSN